MPDARGAIILPYSHFRPLSSHNFTYFSYNTSSNMNIIQIFKASKLHFYRSSTSFASFIHTAAITFWQYLSLLPFFLFSFRLRRRRFEHSILYRYTYRRGVSLEKISPTTPVDFFHTVSSNSSSLNARKR